VFVLCNIRFNRFWTSGQFEGGTNGTNFFIGQAEKFRVGVRPTSHTVLVEQINGLLRDMRIDDTIRCNTAPGDQLVAVERRRAGRKRRSRLDTCNRAVFKSDQDVRKPISVRTSGNGNNRRTDDPFQQIKFLIQNSIQVRRAVGDVGESAQNDIFQRFCFDNPPQFYEATFAPPRKKRNDAATVPKAPEGNIVLLFRNTEPQFPVTRNRNGVLRRQSEKVIVGSKCV